MKSILILFCLLTCLTGERAFSKSRKAKKKSGKARVVDIDFDKELRIKGRGLGPGLFTLFRKDNLQYGKLIKPRKDFLPEMRTTLGDIE